MYVVHYFKLNAKISKGSEKMAEKKKNTTRKNKNELQKVPDKKVTSNKNAKAHKPAYVVPSERLLNQILPFVFVAIALLLEACFVLAAFTGEKHVGMAGVFLKNIFWGLFGFCAFVIPLALVNLAINWRKFVDNGLASSKVVFAIIFLVSFSGLIHIFIKGKIEADLSAFVGVGAIFDYSSGHLFSSGVFGGLFCECIYFLFKSVGTTIIMVALSAVFFILSLGIRPGAITEWLEQKWAAFCVVQREKSDIRKEERREQRELDKQRRAEEAELRRLEEERIAAEEELARKAERELEEEKIAMAERRAIEIEQKEINDKKRYGEMKFVEPEPVVYEEPNLEKIDFEDDAREETEDGRVNLTSVFKNPPKEFLPTEEEETPEIEEPVEKEEPKKSPKKLPKKDEELEIEMKEITDIETVPDDGEEGSVVPENIVREYIRPDVNLLNNYKNDEDDKLAHEEIKANANALMETLKSFGVRIQEITYSRGPTITRYELKPDVGVRIRSIANLVDDIALSLATTGVRIEAPIPNKAAVGIEVPNKTAATVGLRSLIDNREFEDKKSILTAALGKDVGGNAVYFDIGKMPHMLIAGTTGSGKSVCINCIIMSILYKASPRDVKLILIDPKKVEFQPFRSIPHLYAPIVTDPKKAAGALASAVAEMERRFELIESVGAKNISGYNELTANDPSKEYLPYIVIIIDELADLMMTAADDVETAICRIAQKARAAGIHLIVGTQRPSVDVVTGLIKANIPSRIAFTVASQVDSKTILDTAGADKLIGRGDMLFAPIGSTKPMRVQGAFIDDREVERIVDFINEHNDGVSFNDDFIKRLEEEAAKCGMPKGKGGGGSFAGMDDGEPGEEGVDPKFKQALDVAIEMGKISTSLLQRRLEIGYGRAAKIIDRMEALGYVSAPDGNKPRVVLVTKADMMEKRMNDEE